MVYGLQFDNKASCKYCSDLGIKNKYSTPAYPQSNGQAEATNKAIVNGLMKRLEGDKGRWTKELPNVLWAYRTTPQRSIGETPYSLTYGVEAVIPVKISLFSMRISDFSLAENDELMAKHLDLLEEYQEMVAIWLAKYQQKLAQQYDKGVRIKELHAGDLVLCRAVGNAQDVNAEKLSPNWERPYRVTAIARVGAYYLEDIKEKPLPRPWNI